MRKPPPQDRIYYYHSDKLSSGISIIILGERISIFKEELEKKFNFPILDSEITVRGSGTDYDDDFERSITLEFNRTVPNTNYAEEYALWKKEEEEYQLAIKKANDDYEAKNNHKKAQKIADREVRFAKRIESIMVDKNLNDSQKIEKIEFLLKHNEPHK